MDGFIVPESLQTRPADYVVLGLEWPTESWLDVSESTQIQIGDSVAPFNDIDLTVTDYNNSGPIPFTVSLPDGAEAQYRLIMNRGKMLFPLSVSEIRPFTSGRDRKCRLLIS